MSAGTDASTHGFLFADLRGYTSYVERRGARAAAQLLTRYRALVRAAVASQGGAEIRTEGDSFYVVFPSASSAVACALDIVDAAAAGQPDGDPIHVGVGVHAGESIQTVEGPVGSAVNIAARLCALAGPGQVLVSDTVRSLTRSVGTASYTAIGRKRLKGLDEPISVYRATRDAAPIKHAAWRPTGARKMALPLAALALILVAVLLAVWRPWSGGLAVTPSGTAGPSGSIAAPVSPSLHGSLSPSRRPGMFTSNEFALPFSIDLGPRWQHVGQTADLAAYFHETDPLGWIDIVLVAAVLEPPCAETEPRFLGERPEDLIEWLTTRSWVEASAPRPYNIGPYLGRAVDISVLEAATAGCEVSTDEVAFFRLGGAEVGGDFGGIWNTDVGERKRIIAIDVDGRTVTVVVGSPYEDVEQFWSLSGPSLQTLRFTSD